MRLYVETNFVLEMALLREEHGACEGLLALAEARKAALVLPAFSVGEAYEAWVRRTRQRIELSSRLHREIADLSRSKPYQASAEEFRELTGLLIRSGNEERHRINEALSRILSFAELIPIEHGTIRGVQALQTHHLSPQDLIIYASVLSHLEQVGAAGEGLCGFITRNNRDFGREPAVRTGLASLGCRLFTSFRDALGFAQSRL